MTWLIEFVFKCINFMVFCGASYYIFINYLKPSILQQMQEKRDAQLQQHVYQQELMQKLNQLTQDARDQEQLEKILVHKALVWQESLKNYEKSVLEEQNKCHELLMHRIAVQQDQLKHYYRMMKVMPQVITDLEQGAINYFAQKNHPKLYDAKIIETLEKSA